jgi:phospholipid-transporting ATPase
VGDAVPVMAEPVDASLELSPRQEEGGEDADEEGVVAETRTIRVTAAGEEQFCDNTLVTSKYTALNFLPKNLWEQFHRVANVYFLLIATLQVSGYITPKLDLSPTHKLATVMPLTLMLVLTALKEAVEDCARHREDHKVNTQRATVMNGVRGGGRANDVASEWRKVRAGQILEVREGEPFPADMVLLRSSLDGGKCYVETAELDGETNLKIRVAAGDMLSIARRDGEFDSEKFAGGVVECDMPNNELYSFKGTYTTPPDAAGERQTISLSNDCILLRGAALRNTVSVYGLVIYTGKETKLSKNMSKGPLKRSNVEKLVDKLIRFIFLALLAVVITSSAFNLAFQEELASRKFDGQPFYLHFLAEPVHAIDAVFAFITFLILFNTFVPISLYVTLETVKVFQAKLIANDATMYYDEREMWAQARTSNLHEDLGQISYIFSDKTGTLTRNEMVFKKASFDNLAWDPEQAPTPLVSEMTWEHDAQKVAAEEFFTLLSLCHTVVPEVRDGSIHYQAESPDEEALVEGAAQAGYVFTEQSVRVMKDGSTTELYHVKKDGIERVYEKLAVNDFTSTRKRMSAVFKTPEGKYVVFAKGADMMMELNCGVDIPAVAKQHMQGFAVDGLRTLVIACKPLAESEFLEWKQEYDAAKNDILNRSERLAKAAERVEMGMEYIGVTAIEDKLQEGVPDAIASLRQAGLKVWVLTGDKEETAINIGKSCRLLDNSMDLHLIRGSEDGQLEPYSLAQITQTIEKTSDVRHSSEQAGKKLALVVDGKALGELFRAHTVADGDEDEFLYNQARAQKKRVDAGEQCAAVIGCRVSPKQKRDIVKVVKDNIEPTPMTLAIGDGANDVSMIQEAHIGVGISGNEGMQAVRSADYAIGQFRFLKQLMLVHGRWNYRRVCAVILYSFYKGIAYNLTLFCFGFFNGSSGTTLYESWLGSGWNVIWTFLPVIFLGALDQDVDAKTALACPELYDVGRYNHDLNRTKMGMCVLTALAHALTLYAIIYGTFSLSLTISDGTTDGLYIMGTTLNCCLQLTVNLKIVVMSRRLTFWNALVIVGAAASWFLFVLGYSNVFSLSQGKFYGIADQLYHRHTFWLLVLVAPLTAILPDLVVTYLQLNYFPKPWDEKRKTPASTIDEMATARVEQLKAEEVSLRSERRGSTVEELSGYDYSTAATLPQHARYTSLLSLLCLPTHLSSVCHSHHAKQGSYRPPSSELQL